MYINGLLRIFICSINLVKMKLSILFILLFSTATILAQKESRNYLLHVGETPSIIEGDLTSHRFDFHDNTETAFEGTFMYLVQFNEIPSDDQKEAYKEYGIELLKYIPNYAWIAKIDTNFSVNVLAALNVRHFIPVDENWKMSREMRNGAVPSHAGDDENASVNVLFWTQPETTTFESILTDFELTIGAVNTERNSATVVASVSTLRQLSQHPLVQYIEFIEPEIQYEGYKEEAERIISTYISNNPGKNYFFDGTGVRIGVDEGGIVDTFDNPNYRSRITRTFESGTTVSNHKTGVGARMAKAGNIDPREQGTAFGAQLYSGGITTGVSSTNDIVITNRSYGWGCPGNGETYNSSSANYDSDVRNNPLWIITHSAGNAGSSNCYAGSSNWGNITGMAKMAKNIFNVGSSNNDGNLTGFSSRGPSKDGRILPHIVSPGPGGTSHASPNLGGVFSQLNHAFQFHYATTPFAGMLKAIIMNTADDMENPGPDFRTGFGHVNARRAYEVIKAGQFYYNFIGQGGSNQHSITVPANTKKLKVMVYWVDWEATAGISTRSLVNDIDIELEDPNAIVYQPWVLNPTFDPILLNLPAVRATDSLNNNEQVTIDNPVAGTYQLTINGTLIPQGPQQYFMTYEFVTDEIVVTHPHGGEKLVPGETERIRWDACDSNETFTISYSNDNGSSWSSIASSVNQDSRFFGWTVPQDLTDEARIRVERGTILATSDTSFSISALPENLELIWSCADSSLFYWDAYPNADSYTVYRIVGDYMDSVGSSASNSIILNGLSLTETEYVSIAVVQNGVTSRRIIAIERDPVDLNCNMDDLGTLDLLSPGIDNIPSCMSDVQVKMKIRNWGVNAVSTVPVAFRINGGAVNLDTVFATIPSGDEYDFTFPGTSSLNFGSNYIEAWTQVATDGIVLNDSIFDTVWVYGSTSAGPNIIQDFDNFTNCSTAWDCELVTCALMDGWYNVTNGAGDDIDWRTHSGATGSGGTGPSADNTSGTGRYLYIEGSGPCNNSTASLHSPCIDLAGINNATMSFWYHAWGGSIGELHVDAIADGELIEDIMTPIIGEQGNQWNQEIVDLSQFANQQVVVIIRGSNGNSGWLSDLAIDDINIAVGPIAGYASNETQLCSSDIITLSNSSLYGDTYDWSFSPNTVTFEGGTNANSTNPQVSFDAAGSYTVQLVASNTVGNDTLTFVDYIYVWEDQPSLSPISVCVSDSVIVQANNNGQSVDYVINGIVDYSGTNGSHYFANAQDGDSIYVTYSINSGCTLYSDTIEVDITTLETGIAQSGLQINATATGVQYQWLDCLNSYAPIGGETSQFFTPAFDGEYAVQVTENGCVDTSACLLFSTASLIEGTFEQISCYPNPTNSDVTIQFESTKSYVNIELHNLLGQKIMDVNVTNTSELTLELPSEPAVYLIQIHTETGRSVLRVVKR